MLKIVTSHAVIDDYVLSAPSDDTYYKDETTFPRNAAKHWHKRFLSFPGYKRANGGARATHVSDGKLLMDPATDPHYIARSQAFKCNSLVKYSLGKECDGSVMTDQWSFIDLTDRRIAWDRRAKYQNPKYPSIVQAHRIQLWGNFAHLAFTARFKIDADPGEYVLHYQNVGYMDCIDIAVMPKAPLYPPVPTASRYTSVPSAGAKVYHRIDHCQIGEGRWGGDDNQMGAGYFEKHANVHLHQGCTQTGTASPSLSRTCFVIPAEGNVNAHGETRQAAFDACIAANDAIDTIISSSRGQLYGTLGVNVVPLSAPKDIRFQSALDRAIPAAYGNCKAECFAQEPNRSSAQVCFPVRHGIRDYHDHDGEVPYLRQEWTVIDDDPTDEIWYSTCYIKALARAVDAGITTPCMDYTSAQFPTGMCTLKRAEEWRYGTRCVSCADAAANAQNGGLPSWNVLATDQCKLCSYIPLPDVPAPTPAPTIPTSAINADRGQWPRSWTSPDGELFVGWKEGGDTASDSTVTADAMTFVLSCASCDSTGWVGIGVNPMSSATSAKMIGTSVIIWKIGEGTIREYVIDGQSVAGVVPWGSQRHIDHVAMDVANGRATFTLGNVASPSAIDDDAWQNWDVGSGRINKLQETTILTWAYARGGSDAFAYHTARGVAAVDLRSSAAAAMAVARRTTAPTQIPTAIVLGGASSAESSSADSTAAVAVGISFAVASVLLLVGAGAAAAVVAVLLVRRRSVKGAAALTDGEKVDASIEMGATIDLSIAADSGALDGDAVVSQNNPLAGKTASKSDATGTNSFADHDTMSVSALFEVLPCDSITDTNPAAGHAALRSATAVQGVVGGACNPKPLAVGDAPPAPSAASGILVVDDMDAMPAARVRPISTRTRFDAALLAFGTDAAAAPNGATAVQAVDASKVLADAVSSDDLSIDLGASSHGWDINVGSSQSIDLLEAEDSDDEMSIDLGNA
jgi:hypothetical protein